MSVQGERVILPPLFVGSDVTVFRDKNRPAVAFPLVRAVLIDSVSVLGNEQITAVLWLSLVGENVARSL